MNYSCFLVSFCISVLLVLYYLGMCLFKCIPISIVFFFYSYPNNFFFYSYISLFFYESVWLSFFTTFLSIISFSLCLSMSFTHPHEYLSSLLWLTLPHSLSHSLTCSPTLSSHLAERHSSSKCVRTSAFRRQGGATTTTDVELSPPAWPVPAHPSGGAARGPSGTREELHCTLQVPPR